MYSRLALILCLVGGNVLPAQVVAPVGGRLGGRAAARSGAQRPKVDARAMLEQRLQERVNEIVRTRLALNDDQVAQLRQVSPRFEDDKRILRAEEVVTRTALRRELLAGDGANETRVSELLDRLPKLEHRRIDLMEAEQKELAKFLSPSQRARYFALQDELRRNMQDMQRRRLGGAAGDDSVPPPGPSALKRRLRPPA